MLLAMYRSFTLLVALSTVLSSPPADAQDKLGAAVKLLRDSAPDIPRWVRADVADADYFRGSIRFEAPLTHPELSALRGLGVRFAQDSVGEPLHAAGVYPVSVRWAALDVLTELPSVLRIEADAIAKPLRPLDVTGPKTDAPAAAARLTLETGEAPGQGVRVGDIDSGIDVLHPAFFHPDGGYYAWIDANGNGTLDFGTDGVDLDGDGKVGGGEVLEHLDPLILNYGDPHGPPEPSGFQTDTDWLFADTDQNGKRGRGGADGFTDQDPAFGEPLFVVDDVDGDGVLDLNEKLVRLGSSKVAMVWKGGTVFTRGVDLATLTSASYGVDNGGLPTADHGTAVAGILAGNVVGLSRFQGLVPAADLYMISSHESQPGEPQSGDLSRLLWAREQQLQVLLHEYSSWGVVGMDGSSNYEETIDDLFWTDGMLQVIPAGNLAGAAKHASHTLAPGAQTTTGFQVPKTWPGTQAPFHTELVALGLYHPGQANDVTYKLQVPGATVAATLVDGFLSITDDLRVQCQSSVSLAGITHKLCYLFHAEKKLIPSGEYALQIINGAGAERWVHLYNLDGISGWAPAVTFTGGVTDDTTITHPSTATWAISVGAYGGRHESSGPVGALRPYSGRGPRMDGERALDVTAPDDPFAPSAQIESGSFLGNQDPLYAGYRTFGGTSGAGPHVAAVAALLKQTGGGQNPAKLRDTLIEASRAEPAMGEVPNPRWGFGKVDAHRAMYGEAAPESAAPNPVAATIGHSGLTLTLKGGSSTATEDALVMSRWDVDYDGTWDSEWSEDPFEHTFPAEGPHVLILQVRHPDGVTARLLVALDVEDVPAPVVEEPARAEPSSDATGVEGTDPGVDAAIDEDDGGGCQSSPGGRSPVAVLMLMLMLMLALLITSFRGRRPSSRRSAT